MDITRGEGDNINNNNVNTSFSGLIKPTRSFKKEQSFKLKPRKSSIMDGQDSSSSFVSKKSFDHSSPSKKRLSMSNYNNLLNRH